MALFQRMFGPKVSPPTVGDLMARLQEDYEINGRKSLVTARYHWQPILKAFGGIVASELNPDMIRQYTMARKREGKANGTINRELAGLRRGFELGRHAGVVQSCPPIGMLRETGLRQGTYTREEIERITAALPSHLRPVVWFAYHTGRRRGEILQLQWPDVNLEDGWITIRASTTKTGKPDRIPIAGELRALLMALRTAEGPHASPFVFQYQGKPFSTFWRTWKRTLSKLNMPSYLFHDLRRTTATDLVEAGVSEQAAMAVTGHKTRSIFQRYNIVKSDTVRQGMQRLDDYRKGSKA